jgi:hypothetical protein
MDAVCHIRAGIAYFVANLFRVGDEEGCWLAKKKS